MRLLKYIIVAFLGIVLLMTFQSYSKFKFNEFVSNFNEVYYKLVDNINTEDPYRFIIKLQDNENKEKIKKLGGLINDIKDDVPGSKDKVFDDIIKQYNGILYLQKSYEKWDKLTFDDKCKVDTEIWWAYHLSQEHKGKK